VVVAGFGAVLAVREFRVLWLALANRASMMKPVDVKPSRSSAHRGWNV
jgi:hypothetical protein